MDDLVSAGRVGADWSDAVECNDCIYVEVLNTQLENGMKDGVVRMSETVVDFKVGRPGGIS